MVITPESEGYQWKVVRGQEERKSVLTLSRTRNQSKQIDNDSQD